MYDTIIQTPHFYMKVGKDFSYWSPIAVGSAILDSRIRCSPWDSQWIQLYFIKFKHYKDIHRFFIFRMAMTFKNFSRHYWLYARKILVTIKTMKRRKSERNLVSRPSLRLFRDYSLLRMLR